LKLSIVAVVAVALLAGAHAAEAGTLVQFTVFGKYHFDVQLFDQDAPVTVSNFLSYVNSGEYNGTIFHRVYGVSNTPNILQGGGYPLDYDPAAPPPHILQAAPIVNEYALPSAHCNARGTIAMARTSALNSATSEWFINVTDNNTAGAASGCPNWDNPANPYCAFGQILDDPADVASGTLTGMALIDAIAYQQNWYCDMNPGLSQSDPRYSAPVLFDQQQNSYYLFSVTATVVPSPEPASLVLLTLGGVCLLRRRPATRVN
jgi:cyclophilin family peptidyl-prolyl cis-trans isomerase